MSQAAVRDSFPEFEKYELLEEIGHGGMATVYRARDLRLGREVAVKVIHRHLRENPEVATRFVAEGRAAASLKHPGIVSVYDVSDEDDRERFLIVELVRGITLRKLLSEHPELPAEIGAAIMIELCDAMEHAHQKSIIHRDIKPENVLVSLPAHREGGPSSQDRKDSETENSGDEVAPGARSKRPAVVIKITDFGIAKVLDAQGVTSTGQVLGSPAHMAPEQIEGGEVDARTDVFGLGVVLYECFTGHLPFEGKNPAQVLRRVLDGQFAAADQERATVGRCFAAIAEGALASLRDDRLASPAALAELLRKELEELGLTDPEAEIRSYFYSPDSYKEQLASRIVPRLVLRGEEARRKKQVVQAAGHFNRAHALAPDDVSVLRRLTQLGRQGKRRELLRRGLGMGALSLGVIGVVYGAVRVMRTEPAAAPTGSVGVPTAPPQPSLSRPSSAFAPRPADPPPESTAPVAATQLPLPSSGRVAAVPRIGSARGAASAAPEAPVAERPVKFVVRPTGATLEVDGVVIEHVRASPYMLKSGPHTARLTPVTGDKSTEGARSFGFTISPLDSKNPQKAEIIPLSLSFKPAKVKLVGPAGGQAVCLGVTLGVGQVTDVPMSLPVWDVSCKFIVGDTPPAARFVSIRAGEENTLTWPAGG